MKQLSGVYQIVNQINNKCYIGSSIDINRRWTHHKSHLNADKHSNLHLQRAWNKYDEDSFEFEIICFCSKENILKYEQFYIDNLNPEYNIAKDVSAPMLGMHPSAETKRKLSEAMKGAKNHNYGKHLSEEHKRKISAAKRGQIPWNKGKHLSPEIKQRLSESLKGRHPSPETREKISKSLKGQTPWNKGGHPSPETREKMSESQKRRRQREKC